MDTSRNMGSFISMALWTVNPSFPQVRSRIPSEVLLTTAYGTFALRFFTLYMNTFFANNATANVKSTELLACLSSKQRKPDYVLLCLQAF